MGRAWLGSEPRCGLCPRADGLGKPRRGRRVEELSREGYQEMGAFLLREAESGVAVDNETLPEW